jgi:ferritin
MKMPIELEDAFNVHMKNEYFSAHLYRNAAAHASDHSFDGIEYWMVKQAQEETKHGDMFYTHITDMNNRAVMLPIDAPKRDWNSPLELFTYALEHEKFVTQSIKELHHLAKSLNCCQCEPFLLRFLDEQIEEEDQVQTIVDRLTFANGDPAAILIIDQELGARK